MDTQPSQPQNNFTLSPANESRINSVEGQTEQPKPNKKLIIIAVIVLLLLAAGASAYWYFIRPSQIACTMEAKQCPDGSSVGRTGPDCEFAACPQAQDETADWQTYRNEEYGFEVKYPKDWKIFSDLPINADESDVIARIGIDTLKSADNNVVSSSLPNFIIDIKNKPSDYYNLESYVKNILNGDKEYEAKNPSAAGRYFEMKPEKIGDQSGFSIITTDGSVMQWTGIFIYFEKLNYIYVLSYGYRGAYIENSQGFSSSDQNTKLEIANEKLEYDTIQQILSTFKFTISDPTASWQTYRNEQYGFEMKYPKDYSAAPTTNFLVNLVNSSNNASISININGQFNLDTVRKNYAPTGSQDIPPVAQTIGQNNFYYYGPGGGGVNYPDQYFYNMNGKLLVISFDGPYENDKTPTPQTKQMETELLSTFKFTR